MPEGDRNSFVRSMQSPNGRRDPPSAECFRGSSGKFAFLRASSSQHHFAAAVALIMVRQQLRVLGMKVESANDKASVVVKFTAVGQKVSDVDIQSLLAAVFELFNDETPVNTPFTSPISGPISVAPRSRPVIVIQVSGERTLIVHWQVSSALAQRCSIVRAFVVTSGVNFVDVFTVERRDQRTDEEAVREVIADVTKATAKPCTSADPAVVITSSIEVFKPLILASSSDDESVPDTPYSATPMMQSPVRGHSHLKHLMRDLPRSNSCPPSAMSAALADLQASKEKESPPSKKPRMQGMSWLDAFVTTSTLSGSTTLAVSRHDGEASCTGTNIHIQAHPSDVSNLVYDVLAVLADLGLDVNACTLTSLPNDQVSLDIALQESIMCPVETEEQCDWLRELLLCVVYSPHSVHPHAIAPASSQDSEGGSSFLECLAENRAAFFHSVMSAFTSKRVWLSWARVVPVDNRMHGTFCVLDAWGHKLNDGVMHYVNNAVTTHLCAAD
mmetsp:Transcript_21739/g.35953  ORF Transcript_21739/g.35953 Transcript_21739/m.35953 type:complete len:500 (+) Transcript_21739:248-1747(+)